MINPTSNFNPGFRDHSSKNYGGGLKGFLKPLHSRLAGSTQRKRRLKIFVRKFLRIFPEFSVSGWYKESQIVHRLQQYAQANASPQLCDDLQAWLAKKAKV